MKEEVKKKKVVKTKTTKKRIKENILMGIIASIGNIYFVYQFLKKLVTPFEKTEAFKLGIIDKDGKILKRRRDLETKEEKAAYTLSDTLIWNLKKILGKIPLGKSKSNFVHFISI